MDKKSVHSQSDSLEYLYKEWFLDYSSYVILERAIPKIEDGLKPVQRRILHSMYEMHDHRFHKVANIIGHTMKYHPHGDASIGEALVNLSYRSLLIDTQGNFGDVNTGDRAAAPRYIEAKLSNFALDIAFNKNLTHFQQSYDGRNNEPICLPMKFPMVLLNGTEGIAVGLSTRILPHNFIELVKSSINILKDKSFKLFPDFPSYGMIDVVDYNYGKRGGRIRIRSEIEILSKDSLLVKNVPYSVNTKSLINSILKANDKGKIKIKNIQDNTAEEVNIIINLPKGVSPDQTIDALYLFTQCEITLSTMCCIIIDNKPKFTDINTILYSSVENTKDLLKRELEYDMEQLDKKWHMLTIERIFVENKIYRKIEKQDSWEKVIQVIEQSMEPFIEKLKKPMTREDIIKLTEIKIKRISRYDINNNIQKVKEVEKGMTVIGEHLSNLINYTILYYKLLLEKYADDKERKTKIETFDTIKVKQAAIINKKLFIDKKEGFIGFSLKDSELLCECTEFDDILIFRKDGKYIVTKVGDKKFVGKNIMYAGIWKKNDKHMIYNLIYLDNNNHNSYVKRFSIMSLNRDKEYQINKNNNNVKILYITGNPNSESEIVEVKIHFRSKARKKEFLYDFEDISIKNRFSKGNILTKYPLNKITRKELGQSTFGGKDIWYENTVGKLNYDKRGNSLGKFDTDDRILVLYQSGDYEICNVDLSRRFNDNDISELVKYDEMMSISCLHYVGSKKSYYLKRFHIQTSQLNRIFSFVDNSRGSKLICSSVYKIPLLSFNYRDKKGGKKYKEISINEFVGIKKWKAIGNKLSGYSRLSKCIISNGQSKNDSELTSTNEKLTLF